MLGGVARSGSSGLARGARGGGARPDRQSRPPAARCWSSRRLQLWSLNVRAARDRCGHGVSRDGGARARSDAAAHRAGGAGLALAGAWFALTIYPPYQVTLAWLVVALTVGWLLDGRAELPLATHAKLRSAALVAAGVAALAIVLAFAWDAREAIEVMRNTVYPGLRLSTGGDRSIAALLNANLGAPLWANDWGTLFNECEPASFWLLSPAVIALFVWRWLRGERVDPVAAALAGYVAVLTLYATLGFPEALARATALGFAPASAS